MMLGALSFGLETFALTKWDILYLSLASQSVSYRVVGCFYLIYF